MSSFAHRPDAVKRGGPISAAGFRLRAALAVHRAHRHEKGQPRRPASCRATRADSRRAAA
jgi:hypothetical protein